MISNKRTVCPPKYDGSIISQYTCYNLSVVVIQAPGQKLERGWCKLVATGKVSSNRSNILVILLLYQK